MKRSLVLGTLALAAGHAIGTSVAFPAQMIDLSQYEVTFSDDFRGPLDVSAHGSSRWYPHTPWNGDFGDARFVDPQPGFPFATGPDGLTIAARKSADGIWRSGLLSSRDPQGLGFAQSRGYFEARMKMPAGPGVWPAFWVVSEGDGKEKLEVDIIEYYGRRTDRFHQVVHVWSMLGKGQISGIGNVTSVMPDTLTNDWHTYGAEITTSEIVFYFDRNEVWRTPAPTSASQPLMLLVNLALGSGWPIDQTPNPSTLHVDYIRAYRHK